MKNFYLFLLILLFVLLSLGDIFSTFYGGLDIATISEGNPVFLLTKNWWLLTMLKLLFVVGVIWTYYIQDHFKRYDYYMYISILILMDVFLILVFINNMSVHFQLQNNQPLIEATANMTVKEKIAGYYRAVGTFIILPWLYSILCFFIYNKSWGDKKCR